MAQPGVEGFDNDKHSKMLSAWSGSKKKKVLPKNEVSTMTFVASDEKGQRMSSMSEQGTAWKRIFITPLLMELSGNYGQSSSARMIIHHDQGPKLISTVVWSTLAQYTFITLCIKLALNEFLRNITRKNT